MKAIRERVKALVKRGADLDILNKKGETVADIAEMNGAERMKRLLRDGRRSKPERNNPGWSSQAARFHRYAG